MDGYQIEEIVVSTKSTIICKATSIKTNEKVLLKSPAKEIPLLVGYQQLFKEYTICCNLASQSKYFLPPIEFVESKTAIVWKDIGLQSIKNYLENNTCTVDQFLILAKQLIKALHKIHSSGIIHRDISAGNILINPDTLRIYISDFGSSAHWREREENMLPVATGYPVCGTFQYMSPEHTGKINVGIDYRSDIYSLGIVFYELLTGSTPLRGINSRLGILFAHVALEFPPIHLLASCASKIPIAISQIISKMLQKDIEKRYQSCMGILNDIIQAQNYLHIILPIKSEEELLVPIALQFQEEAANDHLNFISSKNDYNEYLSEQLTQLQIIQRNQKRNQSFPKEYSEFPFKLGTKDKNSILKNHNAIYGRDNEIKLIVKLFSSSVLKEKQINSGVVIEGFSGSGKSSLYVKSVLFFFIFDF